MKNNIQNHSYRIIKTLGQTKNNKKVQKVKCLQKLQQQLDKQEQTLQLKAKEVSNLHHLMVVR